MIPVKPAWRTGIRSCARGFGRAHGNPAWHMGARPVHTGAKPVHTGAKPVHAGAKPVHTGAKPVHTGARPVHTGARPVHTGARPVHTGARPVHTGAKPVHTGARPVHTGARPVHMRATWGPRKCARGPGACAREFGAARGPGMYPPVPLGVKFSTPGRLTAASSYHSVWPLPSENRQPTPASRSSTTPGVSHRRPKLPRTSRWRMTSSGRCSFVAE